MDFLFSSGPGYAMMAGGWALWYFGYQHQMERKRAILRDEQKENSKLRSEIRALKRQIAGKPEEERGVHRMYSPDEGSFMAVDE